MSTIMLWLTPLSLIRSHTYYYIPYPSSFFLSFSFVCSKALFYIYISSFCSQNFLLWSISSMLNVQIFRTNVISAAFFSSYMYATCMWKKLPKRHSYKKFVRKMLMKFTSDLFFSLFFSHICFRLLYLNCYLKER